jgi:peptide/nickel transport system substrate-binding protein
MQRRDLLKMTAATLALGVPHRARAGRAKPLKFVPIVGLTVLDPTFAGIPHTRSHGYLVFDTLYGVDETFTARPQMVQGHTVEAAETLWELRLREQLRFHDGTPVLARDAVASIRRCALRNGFCQALMAATDELTAPDDRTIRFRLNRPFPHLPEALAGLTALTPVIMPERLASADTSRPVTEMIGSGPYRFVASDFVMGERSAYERFAGYVPCAEGEPSYTAGPKLAHIERVEWVTIDDAATATAALLRGEVDWLQAVGADQVALLARNAAVKAEVTEPAGSIGVMRFNHLHPPFDNPGIRRALLGAIDQADAMNALAGTDRTYWRDRVGLFHYGTPLANDEGIEVLSGPRDFGKVKRELAQAGYRGERIVVLGTAGTGYIPVLSQVGADTLRRAGMNVDLHLTDYATMARRMLKVDPPAQGGWNVYFTPTDGAFSHTPVTNEYLRGDGKSGAPGWPTSPAFEDLRQAWLDAGDLAEQRRIAVMAQRQLWLDVPYIPMGQWLRVTAHRRDLVDLPRGFAAFYGVRREA